MQSLSSARLVHSPISMRSVMTRLLGNRIFINQGDEGLSVARHRLALPAASNSAWATASPSGMGISPVSRQTAARIRRPGSIWRTRKSAHVRRGICRLRVSLAGQRRTHPVRPPRVMFEPFAVFILPRTQTDLQHAVHDATAPPEIGELLAGRCHAARPSRAPSRRSG